MQYLVIYLKCFQVEFDNLVAYIMHQQKLENGWNFCWKSCLFKSCPGIQLGWFMTKLYNYHSDLKGGTKPTRLKKLIDENWLALKNWLIEKMTSRFVPVFRSRFVIFLQIFYKTWLFFVFISLYIYPKIYQSSLR